MYSIPPRKNPLTDKGPKCYNNYIKGKEIAAFLVEKLQKGKVTKKPIKPCATCTQNFFAAKVAKNGQKRRYS